MEITLSAKNVAILLTDERGKTLPVRTWKVSDEKKKKIQPRGNCTSIQIYKPCAYSSLTLCRYGQNLLARADSEVFRWAADMFESQTAVFEWILSQNTRRT